MKICCEQNLTHSLRAQKPYDFILITVANYHGRWKCYHPLQDQECNDDILLNRQGKNATCVATHEEKNNYTCQGYRVQK